MKDELVITISKVMGEFNGESEVTFLSEAYIIAEAVRRWVGERIPRKKDCYLLPDLNPTENDFKIARDISYNKALTDVRKALGVK